MKLTQLALIFVAVQLLVVAAVSYAMTTRSRRPRLVRGLGIILFVCLEAALLLQIFESSMGLLVQARDILAYTALAAAIALAFGSGDNLLGLLHRTRRELTRSENLSQTLFKQSSEPIVILSLSGVILESNAAASEQLGYQSDKLCSLNLSDLVHPDELAVVHERMRSMSAGDIARVSVRVCRGDSSWIHTDTAARCLENGTFLVILRDVTAQLRHRVNLERFAEISSNTGNQFFNSVVQGLAGSLDLEHVLVGELLPGRKDRVKTLALLLDGKLVSNVEYDLAGAPCNTVVGKSLQCYPSNLQELFPEDTMLVDIGAVSYVGTPLVASNGSPLGLICALSRRPITDPSYCQTVLACYSHRVESEIERLRADAALRESEERYSNVVNLSPFGMHMYRLEEDSRLILEASNPAADWLIGIDHSRLIGKTLEEAFPSLAGTEVPEQYRRVAAHGERWRTESISYKDNRINGAFEVIAFQRSPMKMAAVFMSITERKQAEELRRDSERVLRESQSVAKLGSYLLDIRKGTWTSSDILDDIFGIDKQFERSTAGWASLIHPQFQQDMIDYLGKEVIGRHCRFDREYQIVRRNDGQVRWVHGLGELEFDSNDDPVRMIGTIADITERRQAEQLLRDSEERYRMLYHTTPCMLHSIDAEGRLISVSDLWLSKMGYTRDEVLGRKSIEFLSAESAEYARSVVLPEFFKTGNCRDILYDFVKKDGSIMKIRLSATSEKDTSGKVIRSMAALEDVSELNRERCESQKSLSLLRATLESTADGILVVNGEGKVVGFNQRFLEHWRIPVTLAEQKDDASLIAYVLDQLRDPNAFIEKVKELYSHPGVESFDFLEFKDGRIFERYSQPQRMGCEIIGRVWSFRDVTERKRAEMERTQLEEQLRLSQKLETIGTLAAGIAHDFNNLLVPVIGYTELADSDLDPGNPSHEHLGEVLKAAYRAKSLVGQILAFSRQQSGENKLIHLEAVVSEAAHLLKTTLAPNITLETHYEPELPQLYADATQLHQILMNLCVNASHAMRQGGKLAIEVAATSGESANCSVCGCQLFGRHLSLSVTDNGHGMDQTTLRRIFDPFFTTKPVGEGTGLGLAVTHGIVAHHGGHICATSKVGVGTTFHVYLPAVESIANGELITNTERILISAPIPVS